MVTTPQYLTVEDYLAYDDGTDRQYELVAGELNAMPPESRRNSRIALIILNALMALLPPERLCCKDTEIEVTGVQATIRLPDLMVLSEALVSLLENQPRSIIRQAMPSPLLVVEVVSPGKAAEDRDYRYKRSEYGARGIPEYWVVDPIRAQVLVLTWVDGFYEEAVYTPGDTVQSSTIPGLALAVNAILGR
ncbi:MAG: Uma2 family endonuclease [Leptolyngbyaceae cyanobacterium SM2_5_2]|nr:Uma2 family endonuclease [Leptolyngbyaceae cyanobacterium SM2_5_2]